MYYYFVSRQCCALEIRSLPIGAFALSSLFGGAVPTTKLQLQNIRGSSRSSERGQEKLNAVVGVFGG